MEGSKQEISYSAEKVIWTLEKYLRDNPEKSFMECLSVLGILDCPKTFDDASLEVKVMNAWNEQSKS